MLQTFEEGWKTHNVTGDMYIALAQTYAELGMLDKAVSSALRAVELDSSHSDQVNKFIESVEALQ